MSLKKFKILIFAKHPLCNLEHFCSDDEAKPIYLAGLDEERVLVML